MSNRRGVKSASGSLFISYGHRDMEPFNWLDRLKLYLAPLRRRDPVETWDDSMIQAGADWHKEIASAVERAAAAILLVGPAFLGSTFIAQEELPALLEAARTRGCRIYPVVVGYCAYDQSPLNRYQAFNDPKKPLEALPPEERNRILNAASVAVDADLRKGRRAFISTGPTPGAISEVLKQIASELQLTWKSFAAQCNRRDDLVSAIKRRLKIREQLEFENFFFKYYKKLNSEEKFQFDQIRAMTEGPLYQGNQKIVQLIEANLQVLKEVAEIGDLRQHLVFWLNKFERVFAKTPQMCLLYTGVEDGVPFPDNVDRKIANWLKKHPGQSNHERSP